MLRYFRSMSTLRPRSRGRSRRSSGRPPRTERVIERLHAATGIETRHTALPLERYRDLGSFGDTNDVFIEVATDLAERALRVALDDAGLTPGDVDYVLFTSVTGFSAPSVDGRAHFPARAAPRREADAVLRPRLRRRGIRDREGARLPGRTSARGRRAPQRRTVLPHPAARGRHDGEFRRDRAVRRRRHGRDHGRRRASGCPRPARRRHPQRLLPRHARRHRVERARHRVRDRPHRRCGRRDRAEFSGGCLRFPRRTLGW